MANVTSSEVPAEIIQVEDELLLKIVMPSGAKFGFYIGSTAELRDERGFMRRGAKRGFTLGPITDVRGLISQKGIPAENVIPLANKLKLPLISFEDYLTKIRCSTDWPASEGWTRKETDLPEPYPGKISASQGPRIGERRVRPAFVEAVKEAGSVFTNRFVIDARSNQSIDDYDMFYVDAETQGIQGQVVFVERGFDELGKPTINSEKLNDSLYKVSFNPKYATVIDPTNLLGGIDGLESRCTGNYILGTDGKFDLSKVVDAEQLEKLLETHPDRYAFTTASFKPGFIGLLVADGYYSAKMKPTMAMNRVVPASVIFDLNKYRLK